jgi:hypothetical protein
VPENELEQHELHLIVQPAIFSPTQTQKSLVCPEHLQFKQMILQKGLSGWANKAIACMLSW